MEVEVEEGVDEVVEEEEEVVVVEVVVEEEAGLGSKERRMWGERSVAASRKTEAEKGVMVEAREATMMYMPCPMLPRG